MSMTPKRAALGITVPDTTPTISSGGIDTRPIGAVDTSQRLRHEIRFSDESTPTRRAKPAGVMGCEIWVKVAAPSDPPPTGADDLSFVTPGYGQSLYRGIRWHGRRQDRPLHAPLGQDGRRKRPLVGNHQRHDHGLNLAGNGIDTGRPVARPTTGISC
jgi:hypothetical protein